MIRTRVFIIATFSLIASSSVALAQSSGHASPVTPTSGLDELDIYAKVFAALSTGFVTILGIPVVLLGHRKTRAEITKLELEAKSLREKASSVPGLSNDENGSDESPSTNIQAGAGPVILAPLLLLLDFIFSWAVLTLASYVLSYLTFDVFRKIVLLVLAFVLLLPLLSQVLRVRAILNPYGSNEGRETSIKKVMRVIFVLYIGFLLSSLGFCVGLFIDGDTASERYAAFSLLAWSVFLLIMFPFVMPRIKHYITHLHDGDLPPPV